MEPDIRVRGKILIMDDESFVREVTAEIISRLGFEVMEARDGAEAVDHYTKALDMGAPFDAIIADLSIPGGMGGVEALERLLEIDPGVKAIAASGDLMENYRDLGFWGMVAKPYGVTQLRSTLEAVMEPIASKKREVIEPALPACI